MNGQIKLVDGSQYKAKVVIHHFQDPNGGMSGHYGFLIFLGEDAEFATIRSFEDDVLLILEDGQNARIICSRNEGNKVYFTVSGPIEKASE